MEHDAPAAARLLIEFVHFKRDAGRLGQFCQDPVGQGTKVDRALVHCVCNRQDLRKVRGLPRYATQMMGLDEFKALLPADWFEVAFRRVIGVRPSRWRRTDHAGSSQGSWEGGTRGRVT